MKTFEHIPTGIRVEATCIDHACELIESLLTDDDTRSSGGGRVDCDDVSCLTDLDFDAEYEATH